MNNSIKKKISIIIVFTVIVIVIVIVIGLFLRLERENESKIYEEDEIEEEVLGEFEEMDDYGVKKNVSIKLSEEKEYNGIKISNITLTEKNRETLLLAEAENISGTDINEFLNIDIRFLDKDGNELGILTGIIKPLKANEKTEFNSSITTDLANAYGFEISEHRQE